VEKDRGWEVHYRTLNGQACKRGKTGKGLDDPGKGDKQGKKKIELKQYNGRYEEGWVPRLHCDYLERSGERREKGA